MPSFDQGVTSPTLPIFHFSFVVCSYQNPHSSQFAPSPPPPPFRISLLTPHSIIPTPHTPIWQTPFHVINSQFP
jgi:hypothetical protein